MPIPLVTPLLIRRYATTIPAIRIEETTAVAASAYRTTSTSTIVFVVTPVPTSATVVPISSIFATWTPTVTASPSTKTNARTSLTNAVVDNLTTAPVAEVIIPLDLDVARIPASPVVETTTITPTVPIPPTCTGRERTTIHKETFVQPLVSWPALQTLPTMLVLVTSGSTSTRATTTKLALLAPSEAVSATVPV